MRKEIAANPLMTALFVVSEAVQRGRSIASGFINRAVLPTS